jgi:hypothetical protein
VTAGVSGRHGVNGLLVSGLVAGDGTVGVWCRYRHQQKLVDAKVANRCAAVAGCGSGPSAARGFGVQAPR